LSSRGPFFGIVGAFGIAGLKMDKAAQEKQLLGAFILELGLRLSDRIKEVFRTEVFPGILSALASQGARFQGDFENYTIMFPRTSNSLLANLPGGRDVMSRGWKQAEDIVVSRLRELVLVAAGARLGDGESEKLEVILPAEWEGLRVDRKTDSASRDGIVFRNIRIARMEHLTEAQRQSVREAVLKSVRASLEATSLPTDDGVRDEEPSSRGGRRARARQLAPTLAAEARALIKIRKQHPDVRSGKFGVPSEGTVKNHIRNRYRQLKADPAA
jgi:hypothetical protein